MKTTLLFLCLTVFSTHLFSQLDTIIWEVHYEDDGTIPGYPAGFKTYRVYALLQDPTDKLVSIGSQGTGSSELIIGSSTNRIWNNSISSVRYNFGLTYPPMSLESMDSYLTIGNTIEETIPEGNMSVICRPAELLMSSFALGFNEGSVYQKNLQAGRFVSDPEIVNNNYQINSNLNQLSIYAFGGNIGLPTGPDNRVIIAQITTDGIPKYSLNVGILDSDSNSTLYYYYGPTLSGPPSVGFGLCYPPESCGEIFGCADPAACNYGPEALSDPEMCRYDADCFGCTHFIAQNYNPLAVIDDHSCIYNIEFRALNDYDQNSLYTVGEPFFNPEITGTVLSTNQNSGFANNKMNFTSVPAGTNILTLDMNGGNYSCMWGNPFEFYLPFYETNVFYVIEYNLLGGVYNPGTYTAQLSVDMPLILPGDFYSSNTHFHIPPSLCNVPSIHTISFHNTSNQPVNAQIEIDIDPLYQNIIDAASADSIVGNRVYYSWQNLPPNTLINEPLTLLTPLAEFAGQTVEINTSTTVYDLNDSLVLTAANSFQRLLQCSYDPNNKEADPKGYTEENFILAGDTIIYTINFQNTGNAPADYVKLYDHLPISKLNISSFEIISASHNYTALLDNSGLYTFQFHNINLPDSTTNEPASHGHITFKIVSKPNLSAGELILNAAEIIFDNNPGIITNTVKHTIFDCASLQLPLTLIETCENIDTEISVPVNYVEHYEWFINETPDTFNQNNLIVNLVDTGYHSISVNVSNPLCSAMNIYDVYVHEFPEIEIVSDSIYGPPGYMYTWYHDGQPEEGNTGNSTFIFLGSADGADVYAEVSSDWGCNGATNWIHISGVLESGIDKGILFFPNPVNKNGTLILASGNWNVNLYNGLGKNIKSWSNVSKTLEFSRDDLSSGIFYFVATDNSGQSYSIQIVVE